MTLSPNQQPGRQANRLPGTAGIATPSSQQPAITTSQGALPRLGETFRSFNQKLGTPTRTGVVDGCVLRQYRTERSALTALFQNGKSVAVYVPYQLPMPSRGRLQGELTQLTPADGAAYHLLIDDNGWFLTTRECPRRWLAALVQALNR